MQEAKCGLGRQEKERCLEAARKIFLDAAHIVWLQFPLTRDDLALVREQCQQPWLSDTVDLLMATNPDGNRGYAVADEVRGKDQLITYLVTVSPDLAVKEVEIITYRESYGGEVRNKAWREQFHGKTPDDKLLPKREIRNISGATISARAITLGVKKILCTLRLIRERLPH